MNRKAQKVIDFISLNRNSILGLGFCLWFSKRLSNNMAELEKNTQEKKLFDPLKAKAQVQVYKEIYNVRDMKDKNDAELRILKTASANDLEDINKFFDRAQNGKTQAE